MGSRKVLSGSGLIIGTASFGLKKGPRIQFFSWEKAEPKANKKNKQSRRSFFMPQFKAYFSQNPERS
tara:strand:- start:534 stop:734 length:201 start_codon:yes stop_codon:yes gene_type:complete